MAVRALLARLCPDWIFRIDTYGHLRCSRDETSNELKHIMQWLPIQLMQEVMWQHMDVTPLDACEQTHGQGLQHFQWLIYVVKLKC